MPNIVTFWATSGKVRVAATAETRDPETRDPETCDPETRDPETRDPETRDLCCPSPGLAEALESRRRAQTARRRHQAPRTG